MKLVLELLGLLGGVLAILAANHAGFDKLPKSNASLVRRAGGAVALIGGYFAIETLLRRMFGMQELELNVFVWYRISPLSTIVLASIATAIVYIYVLRYYVINSMFFGTVGMLFYRLGLAKTALFYFHVAIQVCPASSVVYKWRALAYRALGNLEQAVEDLTSARAIRPADAQLLISRGLLYCELDTFEPAVSDFVEAIRLRPSIAPDLNLYVNHAILEDNLDKFDDNTLQLAQSLLATMYWPEISRSEDVNTIREFIARFADFPEGHKAQERLAAIERRRFRRSDATLLLRAFFNKISGTRTAAQASAKIYAVLKKGARGAGAPTVQVPLGHPHTETDVIGSDAIFQHAPEQVKERFVDIARWPRLPRNYVILFVFWLVVASVAFIILWTVTLLLTIIPVIFNVSPTHGVFSIIVPLFVTLPLSALRVNRTPLWVFPWSIVGAVQATATAIICVSSSSLREYISYWQNTEGSAWVAWALFSLSGAMAGVVAWQIALDSWAKDVPAARYIYWRGLPLLSRRTFFRRPVFHPNGDASSARGVLPPYVFFIYARVDC